MKDIREFGLIKYPVGHSYSQKYFEQKFEKLGINDAKYTSFPISEIHKINNVVSSHKNLCGLNINAPYKELVIPYLHDIDPVAMKLGTVNVVKVKRTEKSFWLKGYNTDVCGLQKAFDSINIKEGSKVLILGSGGSGKTVSYVLKERQIPYTVVSRESSSFRQITYDNITEAVIRNHNIIINATPVGMYPNVDVCPSIPYQYITKDHICLDMVYNPEQTLFIKKCGDTGAETFNGLAMFYTQADKSWEIWNTEKYDLTESGMFINV
jgi:shikimate dehydrogenase